MPRTKRSTPSSAKRSSSRKRKLTTTVVTKPTKTFFKPLEIKPAPEPLRRKNTPPSEPGPTKESTLETTESGAASGAMANQSSLSSSEPKRPQRRTSRRHFLAKPTTNSAKLSTSPEESDEPIGKDETQLRSEDGEQTLTASQDSILPLSKNRAADEPTFKVDCGNPTTPKLRRSSRLNAPITPSQESNASSSTSVQLKLPLCDMSKKRTAKQNSAKPKVEVIEITDLELDVEAKKVDQPASTNDGQTPEFNTPPGDPALEPTDDSKYPMNELVLPPPIPSSGGLSFTSNVLASAIEPGTARKSWSTCVPFSGVFVPPKKRAVKGTCCTKCGAPADFRVPEHASPVTPVEDMSPLRPRRPKSVKRKTVGTLSSSEEKILSSSSRPFLRRNLPKKRNTPANMQRGGAVVEEQEKPRRASRLSLSRSLAAKQTEVDTAALPEPPRRFTRGASRRTRAVKRGAIEFASAKDNKVAGGACIVDEEPVDVDREDEPVEVDVVDLCAESPKRRPFSWTRQGSPKRRRTNFSFGPGNQAKVAAAIEAETAAPTAKPKQLHSFFTNKPKIVSSVRSDMRKQPVAPHPWKSAFATVHVNAPKYDGPCSTPLSLLDLPINCAPNSSLPSELSIPEEIDGEDLHANSVVNERQLSDEAATALWSEVYQYCGALGSINSSTTSLQDWLRMWYRFKPERSEEMCSEDYSSDDVFVEDLELGLNENTEKIAIVTGPVGCGKSTVVKQVARRLGLSILEINQTMCRASKKVRELVTNALENHRATKNRQSPADTAGEGNGYSARTLILFEEVDELHDDEAGFWRMVREIINDEKCKRPIVCTANRITSTMQAVFGYVTPNDEKKDIRELLTEYPPEEQLNTLPFKHFPLQQKSPSEIMKVLKVVNEREGLRLSNRGMVKFARSIRSEEIRTVLNTLQFSSTPSIFGVVSQVSRRAESCSRLLCTEDSMENAADIAYQERMDEDAGVLEGILYGVTELSSQGHDGLCEVADFLETFSDADVVSRYQGFEEDHAMADELDLLPCADEQQYWNRSRFIATDMRVNALTSLNTSFRWDEVDPVWLTNQVEEYVGNGRKSEEGVETVRSLLNKRTVVTDILPSLRTMAVASREARERAASGKAAKGKQARGKFSKVPLGTRSRTRGNHMHLLGIGEEASIYLEHNCMLPEHR